MRPVTVSVGVSVQAPSVAARPNNAPSRHSFPWRSTDSLFVMAFVPVPAVSVDDEAKVALIASNRFDATGKPVNAIDLGQQGGLDIRCRREPVIRARQFSLGD